MTKGTGSTDTEHHVTEGFTLEWSSQGLLIRAIDYHASELFLGWGKLSDKAGRWCHKSLREVTAVDSKEKRT